MTSREIRKLEFARKKYDTIPNNTELREKVREMEDILTQPRTIWDDDFEKSTWDKVNRLSLSDRRLLIVFSIIGSVQKVAKMYGVDRSTVNNNLTRIRKELEC